MKILKISFTRSKGRLLIQCNNEGLLDGLAYALHEVIEENNSRVIRNQKWPSKKN